MARRELVDRLETALARCSTSLGKPEAVISSPVIAHWPLVQPRQLLYLDGVDAALAGFNQGNSRSWEAKLTGDRLLAGVRACYV